MSAESYFDISHSAQILRAAQKHQLGLSGVYFKSVSTKPNVERGQNILHAGDDVLNCRLLAADQDLSVVSVLNNHCVLSIQTEVVCEDAVEERA